MNEELHKWEGLLKPYGLDHLLPYLECYPIEIVDLVFSRLDKKFLGLHSEIIGRDKNHILGDFITYGFMWCKTEEGTFFWDSLFYAIDGEEEELATNPPPDTVDKWAEVLAGEGLECLLDPLRKYPIEIVDFVLHGLSLEEPFSASKIKQELSNQTGLDYLTYVRLNLYPLSTIILHGLDWNEDSKGQGFWLGFYDAILFEEQTLVRERVIL